jgi:hypothetical protein
MEAQQEGAQKRAGPFRVRPADEAFEAVSIGGAAEGLAVAAHMIAEFDPVGRFRKERSQAALSLAERKGRQIFAFDLEEVEGEINQTGTPALGGLLHKLERCHAIRTNTAKFAVEIEIPL